MTTQTFTFILAALAASNCVLALPSASTRSTNSTLENREPVPEWALALFSSQNCAYPSILFTDEDDNGKDCTEIPQTAYSAEFNGNDYWIAFLYLEAECNGAYLAVGPGVSGCKASAEGYKSYEVYTGKFS